MEEIKVRSRIVHLLHRLGIGKERGKKKADNIRKKMLQENSKKISSYWSLGTILSFLMASRCGAGMGSAYKYKGSVSIAFLLFINNVYSLSWPSPSLLVGIKVLVEENNTWNKYYERKQFISF